MQTDDLTVKVKTLGGTWESFGVDRAAGIWPENFTCSSNDWGSDKASFDLRRDPAAVWPDLQAFSDVEVEIAAEIVWSGRISETPARDGEDPVINVQCEGWQYHLDDDSYADLYVHSRLADWRDVRQDLTVNLTSWWLSRLTVQSEGGQITLGAPNNTVWPSAASAGVQLDLGPYARAKRIVVTWKRGPGNPGNITFIGRGADVPEQLTGSVEDFFSISLFGTSQTSNISVGTITTPRRYVTLFAHCGGTYTTGADDTLSIMSVQVFSETAYESGNASVLKASTIIQDARSQILSQLSADESQIATTTFNIPDFHFERDPKTAREVIAAANVFHNYLTQVDVNRQLVFQPRPAAPLFEVGTWGGSTFEDSSMNSGQDIYSRVLVTGTGPDGTPMLVERLSSTQPGVSLAPASTVAPTNPSFDASTANWTAVVAALTRDTGTFDTSPASLKIVAGGASQGAIGDTTGTFKAGKTYIVRFRIKGNVGGELLGLSASSGSTIYGTSGSSLLAMTSSFATYDIAVNAPVDVTNMKLNVVTGLAMTLFVDSVQVLVAEPTIVDRFGFRRTKILPIGAALTTAVANQIGDTWLAAHRAQPLKGAITATVKGIRRIGNSRPVHPAHMLRQTGQLIRLAHRTDPDTGGLHRDGQIASVTYTHDRREAALQLDYDRRNYEALIARYAAIAPA